MAYTLTTNVPSVWSDAEIRWPVMTLTNLVHISTERKTSASGIVTTTSQYDLQAGDKTLPTDVEIKSTVRPATAAQPNGSTSLVVRLNTHVDILEDAEIVHSAVPLNFAYSMNFDHQVMFAEATLHQLMLMGTSILWQSYDVSGTPLPTEFTALSYGNTQIIS